MENHEQTLLDSLRLGDERAFDKIFRKFYPYLCFFARKFVTVAGTEEEIVQDTLFKLWERRANFESYDALKAFLYISVKNSCLNTNLSNQRKLNRDHNWHLLQEEIEHDVEEYIVKTEIYMEIDQAINSLPEQCKKVIKMSYKQEMNGKEIAKALQVTVSTVNNQKARGIMLLRNKLNYKNLTVIIVFIKTCFFTTGT